MIFPDAEKDFEKSQVFNLTVPPWKVLLALAYEGQESPYRIAMNYKMPYAVVHRAVKAFKEHGWIRVMRTEKNVKNHETAFYGLTDIGLLWFFSRLPKEIPHRWFEELFEKDMPKNQEKKEAPYPYDLKKVPEYVALENAVSSIATDDDVHAHLLLDLDVDRIVEKIGMGLFPLVFGAWKTHRDFSMTGLIESSLPEIAFSTLIEAYYGYEGLSEKYGSLDEVLAYKTYKKIIESCANIEKSDIESYAENVKSVSDWMHCISIVCPKVFHLCVDITLELEKNFSNSLSFTKEIISILNLDDLSI